MNTKCGIALIWLILNLNATNSYSSTEFTNKECFSEAQKILRNLEESKSFVYKTPDSNEDYESLVKLEDDLYPITKDFEICVAKANSNEKRDKTALSNMGSQSNAMMTYLKLLIETREKKVHSLTHVLVKRNANLFQKSVGNYLTSIQEYYGD